MTARWAVVGVPLGVLVTLGTVRDLQLCGPPVSESILAILEWRSPIEVFKVVVLGVVVAVAAMHACLGPRANERLQDEGMHHHLLSLSIPIKSAGWVVGGRAANQGQGQHSSPELSLSSPSAEADPINGSNAAMVGNLIGGIARYWEPMFITGHKAIITGFATSKPKGERLIDG